MTSKLHGLSYCAVPMCRGSFAFGPRVFGERGFKAFAMMLWEQSEVSTFHWSIGASVGICQGLKKV